MRIATRATAQRRPRSAPDRLAAFARNVDVADRDSLGISQSRGADDVVMFARSVDLGLILDSGAGRSGRLLVAQLGEQLVDLEHIQENVA
jgi:hypothetical protein